MTFTNKFVLNCQKCMFFSFWLNLYFKMAKNDTIRLEVFTLVQTIGKPDVILALRVPAQTLSAVRFFEISYLH